MSKEKQAAKRLVGLGALLAAKRGDLGLRKVAALTGVSFATLSRIERGSLPSATTATRLYAWLEGQPIPVAKNETERELILYLKKLGFVWNKPKNARQSEAEKLESLAEDLYERQPSRNR